jgi:hypothetical protein
MGFRRGCLSQPLETILKLAYTVTPAKAGVQNPQKTWIPAFAGMTAEYHPFVWSCAKKQKSA